MLLRFLNQEMKAMIALHDEACTTHSDSDDKDNEENVHESIFEQILAKSKVAQLLKRVYEDVVARGSTFVRVLYIFFYLRLYFAN